jgi:hypothetical protein
MKQSFINQITLCDNCKSAFIINVEGDGTTCDGCIAERELTHEIIDSGALNGVVHDCY